jgi:hypothetical protein
MVDPEPDYSSLSSADLLDIERYINRHAYPERWLRLQAEIERRGRPRVSTNVRSPIRMPAVGYSLAHFLVTPVIVVALLDVVETTGEGSEAMGWVAFVSMMGGWIVSFASIFTYDWYAKTSHPWILFFLSLVTTVAAGSAAAIALIFGPAAVGEVSRLIFEGLAS